ncbi:uncharacterized protein LOC143914641 [Arctopsyche grandis]|uniref:uncharacterized protein LOC143914641 n=1 Tax=Arctopsyche grandis TaxID=121162 RepID=UPI00406D6442
MPVSHEINSCQLRRTLPGISTSSSSSKPSRIFRNNKIHRAEQHQAFQKIRRLDKNKIPLVRVNNHFHQAFQKIRRLDENKIPLVRVNNHFHQAFQKIRRLDENKIPLVRVNNHFHQAFQKHYKRRYNPNNVSRPTTASVDTQHQTSRPTTASVDTQHQTSRPTTASVDTQHQTSRPTAASVDTQQQTSQHTAPDQPPLHYADLEDQPAGRASNTLPYPETFRT